MSEGRQGLIQLRIGLVSRLEKACRHKRKILKRILERAECFDDMEQLEWDLDVLKIGRVSLRKVPDSLVELGCTAESFYAIENSWLQEAVDRSIRRLNLMTFEEVEKTSCDDVLFENDDKLVYVSDDDIARAYSATDKRMQESIYAHLCNTMHYGKLEYSHRDIAIDLNILCLVINFLICLKLIEETELKHICTVVNLTHPPPPLEYRPQLQPNAPSFLA